MICPKCNSQNTTECLYRKTRGRNAVGFRCEDCNTYLKLPPGVEGLLAALALVLAIILLLSSVLYVGQLVKGVPPWLNNLPYGLVALGSMILLGVVSQFSRKLKSVGSRQRGVVIEVKEEDLIN